MESRKYLFLYLASFAHHSVLSFVLIIECIAHIHSSLLLNRIPLCDFYHILFVHFPNDGLLDYL